MRAETLILALQAIASTYGVDLADKRMAAQDGDPVRPVEGVIHASQSGETRTGMPSRSTQSGQASIR